MLVCIRLLSISFCAVIYNNIGIRMDMWECFYKIEIVAYPSLCVRVVIYLGIPPAKNGILVLCGLRTEIHSSWTPYRDKHLSME